MPHGARKKAQNPPDSCHACSKIHFSRKPPPKTATASLETQAGKESRGRVAGESGRSGDGGSGGERWREGAGGTRGRGGDVGVYFVMVLQSEDSRDKVAYLRILH